MPDLLGPAVDPTLQPALLVISGGDADVALEEPSAPGPGDPDVEFDPAPAEIAPRVQLMLYRHDKTLIGELVTAEVEEWGEELDLLVPPTLKATASTFDPLWAAAATVMGTDTWGRIVYSWAPKGYYVQVSVDGAPEPPFFFRQPIDIGGGRVALYGVGVQAVVTERILGRAEQVDLLEGRGSFEEYSSIDEMEADGWQFDAGVTPGLVADGVRGAQALQLQGTGWVRSPRVTRQGAAGYGRVLEGAMFGRWSAIDTDEALDAVGVVQRTRAVRRSNGAEDTAYRDANALERPDDVDSWSEDPLVSAGRMQPAAVAHDCGVDVRSYAGVTTRVDYVTLREGTSTGFPPGSSRDYAYYVERVFRDLHSRELGGSPTGLSTRIMALTGSEPVQARRWAHSRRMPVREILAEILDAEGGPECRVTAGWWLEVWDRLGADRTDVALSNLDILDPGWAEDPGAQVDVLVADTGRGTATSAIASTVEQPYSDTDTAWRIVATVQAPADWSLNAIDAWTARQAEVAARRQITATVAVRWELGRQIDTGDTLRAFQSDGLQGDSRRHRVIARRFRRRERVVLLTLGAAD